MPKFKIKAYALDFFEQEIEANNEDEAKEIFLKKQDAGDLEFEELVVFEDEEGFDILEEVFKSE